MDLDKMLEYYNDIKFDIDLEFLLEEKFYLSDMYYFYEYEYEFRFTDDPYGAFINAGYDLINKYALDYEEVMKYIKADMQFDNELSDDEIMIIVVTLLAKYFKHRVDQYNGLVQGDEWATDPDKVEYYGSRGIADSRGYDDYMDKHLGGDVDLLQRGIEEYSKIGRGMGSK